MKEHTSKKQTGVKAIEKERKDQKGQYAFNIGIDWGDKNSDVCLLDPKGELSKEFRVRMQAPDLQSYFASIPRSRVAIEAGGQSRWVAELVEGCGHAV